MSEFLYRSDTGTMIYEHSIPVPLYEIGDQVVFRVNEEQVSDTIVGYQVAVIKLKDGIINQISYDLITGDSVLEDEIESVM